MKRLLLPLAAIAFFVLILPYPLVQGQDEAVAAKFRKVGRSIPNQYKVGRSIPNQYIVVFKDDVPDVDIDSLASNMASVNLRNPKAIYRYALKGFSIHGISERQAIALSNDPRIEFVEENCLGTTGSIQSIDYSSPHAGLAP
ncbi:MAG TPA: protease inhibitor I9 family protein [Blastocatellia bacterium]|nr:protease inhibitor I9 family protein [Blastocatellia bacterium]